MIESLALRLHTAIGYQHCSRSNRASISSGVSISLLLESVIARPEEFSDGFWFLFPFEFSIDPSNSLPQLGEFVIGTDGLHIIDIYDDKGFTLTNFNTGVTSQTKLISALGDVNADGSIDVLDIVVVVNIIVDIYNPSDDEFAAADMNNDGVVDVLDIVTLVNTILGG